MSLWTQHQLVEQSLALTLDAKSDKTHKEFELKELFRDYLLEQLIQ